MQIHIIGVECTSMNGYGGALHELAGGYGISVRQTPPAQAGALHHYISERIAAVDHALPKGGLPRDQELRRGLVIGLLCQDSGLQDDPDVRAARTVERLIATLEYECNCSDGENTMRHVICTDRRGRDIVTPDQLARPLLALANETVHAQHHLLHLLAHLYHCPSFRPGIDAIKLLEDALPPALRLLVGDSEDDPRKTADWILTGGHS